jgi:transcriptional regulator with XRE-family HTH domain
MERQFFINWPAIVEEAKQRRKELKLTQVRLAQMAQVSTPTLSRFENDEKDIQLSSVIRILSVLGINDNRDLIFPKNDEYYDASRKAFIFSGKDRDKTILCAISKEALEDYFHATNKNSLKIFEKNREKIYHQVRRKYLQDQWENDGFILLSLKDLIHLKI